MLQNLGWFAILLGSLVIVHELGHFIVAKACGVKVLRFSVGFGPKLYGWTRGETEYWISWLPLGGYVKMAGNIGEDELAPEEAHRGFLAQPPWKRGLIAAAGPGFSLLFPLFIYFAMFAGYPQSSTRVMSLNQNFPPAQAGLQLGDRIVAVNGHPFQSEMGVVAYMDGKNFDDLTLTVERDGVRRDLKLATGKTPDGNAIRVATPAVLGFSPEPELPILGLPADSAAAVAGLKTFDRVVSVDGQPVNDTLALNQALDAAAAKGTAKIQAARFTPGGLPGAEAQSFSLVSADVTLVPGVSGLARIGAESHNLYIGGVTSGGAAQKAGLVRGDRLLQINGKAVPDFQRFMLTLESLGTTPFQLTYRHGAELKTVTLKRAELERAGDLGQREKKLVVGIEGLSGYFGDSEPVDKVRIGVTESMGNSFEAAEKVTGMIAGALGLLVTNRVSLDNLGGPVMLYKIAAKSASEGFEAFLDRMAMISINLGLVNLLPMPGLDGFMLLSALWEGVRRRPIPDRAREVMNTVGVVLLVLLMVRVLFNDVTRLVL